MQIRMISLATLACVCAGCKVTPKYVAPTAPVPPAYQEAASAQTATADGWKAAVPADAFEKNHWWEIYRDPQLNALEERIEVDNQSLKAAAARFTEARAMVSETRSQKKPSLGANGGIARDRQSLTKGVPPPASESDYGDFTLGLTASWEPDLWGRIGTLINSSVQQAQASAADLENVRLSLHAELAADYLMLRCLDNEKAVLTDSVQAYAKALKMMEDRYQGGVANRADVEQARTQLEAASAQEADLSESRTHYLHAIAVLTGQLPEGFAIAERTQTLVPPSIPMGVPSELLERRPDIAAAERRVALANSQVGLAHTAYYPQVILSAAIGLNAASLDKWFTAPSRYWAVGPSLTQTLFDAGRRRAGVAQAASKYDESVANYRQSVLTAFQQVEDSMSSLRILEEEAARQQRAVAAARSAEELSMNRYQGGMVTYLEVISTQSTRLQNERIAVGIERRRMEASVALIRALGGGWNANSLPKVAEISKTK
jgi:NodT family efflux transporter outer membrane factor (OMF) lipoprotein